MPPPSRTTQFNKLHKVLKKHYKPVTPDPNRPVLEHVLFACCAENAHYEAAEEAFAALVHNFFDFNEIRVSSVRELSEVMSGLPEPPAAANRLKRVLQSVFESTYAFDLEGLRKLNLGPAADKLAKLDGTTKFSVAYVIQAALGGHAIPVDLGVLWALYTVSLVMEEDVDAGVVPGLERAIAKSKGIEFASLLHQLGGDFIANPYAPALHQILVEINSEASERLPKRRGKKQAETFLTRQQRRRVAQKRARKKARRRRRAQAERADTEGKRKRAGSKKTPAQQQPPGAPKKDAAAEQKTASAAGKKPVASKKKSAGKKPPGAAAKPEADAGRKRSTSSGLSKRKPR